MALSRVRFLYRRRPLPAICYTDLSSCQHKSPSPHPFLLSLLPRLHTPIPHHLLHQRLRQHRRKMTHDLQILLLAHLRIPLTRLRQYLKVIDVETRGIGIHKLGFRIEGVAEGVRGARGNDDEVAHTCVDVRVVGRVVAYGAERGVEAFVVHFVPVGGWAGGVRGKSEFGDGDAVVCGAD